MTTFYLGAHMPHWLDRTSAPLCVSRNRLAGRRTFPRALGPWVLDSGGFTEIKDYGGWRCTPAQYVAQVRRFRVGIGDMVWAAPMDWMCEPPMLAKTGLSIVDHQWRTVLNFVQLCDLAPDLPFIPVLQGWTLADYLRCVEIYGIAGVDLKAEPLVGLGSVCRRQATGEIAEIVTALAESGLRLHGFGVKIQGLKMYGPLLTSCDSLAWSYDGRRTPGCLHGSPAMNEANCLPFALTWRDRVLDRMATT